MEDVTYIMSIRIGLQMKFEFEGTLIDFDKEKNTFSFEESEDMIPKKGGDIVVIDLNRRSVAFSSHHFSMVMDIVAYKEVDGNFHYRCATDISRVDVYICKKALWLEKKETIFF